ncbi:hypothetical protein A9Q83_18270 [Alphaproteobacteria bacterium 46_93_T64]|nr:hypothetical protein A9Q83_18270 [Alphaproteobacteria bacterium 46_93_T64]
MKLSKQHLDIGLFTNNKEEMLPFWQEEIGLQYDHLGKLGGGVHQHRHFLGDGPTGPILKINHARDQLVDAGPSGYQNLFIARDNIKEPVQKTDPDGNIVTLVPMGYNGITYIAIEMAVKDLTAFQHFYGTALAFPATSEGDRKIYRAGETLIFANEARDYPKDIPYQAKGYRYLTAQIFGADTEHENILRQGGQEGSAPRTLGTTVRFSFVRDGDGNWIELSERATLTGKAV